MIRISKSERMLYVVENGCVKKRCSIGLGSSPTGRKRMEGDGKTPEGVYFICTRNARSKYTLFLGISYPNTADAKSAYQHGTIDKARLEQIVRADAQKFRPPWDTPMGGMIGIHGGGIPQGKGLADSTAGCIAVMDSDIRELWRFTGLGTSVHIVP